MCLETEKRENIIDVGIKKVQPHLLLFWLLYCVRFCMPNKAFPYDGANGGTYQLTRFLKEPL